MAEIYLNSIVLIIMNGVRLVDLLKRDSEWEFCRAEELGEVEVETCPVTRVVGEVSGQVEAPPPEYHVDVSSVQRGHVDVSSVQRGQHGSGGWDDDGFEYPASLTQGSPGCGKMAWGSRVDVMRNDGIHDGDGDVTKRVLLPAPEPEPQVVVEKKTPLPPPPPPPPLPQGGDVKLATAGAMFTTGGGCALKISKSKLEAASRLFDGLDDTPVKSKDDDDDDDDDDAKDKVQAPSNMFMTGSGSRISISKDKIAAAAKLLDLDEENGSKNSNTTPAPKDVQASVALAKTPAPAGKGWTAPRSRFAPPVASGSTCMAPTTKKKMPEFQTPGNHTAVTKRPRSSTSSAEHAHTPGLVTPQVFQQVKQAPYSTSMKQGNTNGRRIELPLTPHLASRYLFDGNYGPGDVRSLLLTSGAKPDVVQDDWVRCVY